MKQNIVKSLAALTVLVLITFSSCANKQKDDGFVELLNGKNWDGWHLKIRSGDQAMAEKIFTIEDDVIHAYKYLEDSADMNTGENATHGLFYTNKSYSKYVLKFEYKWGTKITNNFDRWQYDAGCYYHVSDDKIWPIGLEYQVRYDHKKNENHTGDFIVSQTKAKWYSNEDAEFCLPKDGGQARTYDQWMFLASPDVEHNALNDKWNKCEIVVMSDKYLIHKLNGKVVNIATDMSVSEGIIGFQSETAEIFYRNIKIKEFDKIVPMEKFL